MRTLQEAQKQFEIPWSDVDFSRAKDELKPMFKELVSDIFNHVPEGPERTLALRKLQEAQWYVTAALALQEEEQDT